MRNQVHLITYVDRLGGGGLTELHALLRGPLAGLFGGVHLLPFFHPIDGADAGFDPIDHRLVDPRLGDWTGVKAIGDELDVMADVIVNHASASSPAFRDYLARGEASPAAELFLPFDRVFPRGATAADLLALHNQRPSLPFSVVTLGDGSTRLLWTSFTAEQIDLDVESAAGIAYLDGILATFRDGGVRQVRLDAVGYAIKRPGTSCFMLPETFAFIDRVAGRARELGMEVLVEVHGPFENQVGIARRVDRVYDFALPPLVLHALFHADPEPLVRWLGIAPRNAVTVLDTHDGIGVADALGLLDAAQVAAVAEGIHRRSGGASRRSSGAAAANLDHHQVNCTFPDALGRDPVAHLAARAIQFFAPGVPQVYYVGLLAGANDLDLLASTGVGRDINRRRYSPADVEAAVRSPEVLDLFDLIRMRNAHPAFAGELEARTHGPGQLVLRRAHGSHEATLEIDLATLEGGITLTGPEGDRRVDFAPRSRGLR